MTRARGELSRSLALNEAMQRFLRDWSAVSVASNEAVMLDQASLGWFAEMNRGLRDSLTEDEFFARLRANTALLETLAAEIVATARTDHPHLDATGMRGLRSQHAHEGLLFKNISVAAA